MTIELRWHLKITYSRSHNRAPDGNGVHFMFEVVSRLFLSEESDGADHFLKQKCPTCLFWPIFGPQIKAKWVCWRPFLK